MQVIYLFFIIILYSLKQRSNGLAKAPEKQNVHPCKYMEL